MEYVTALLASAHVYAFPILLSCASEPSDCLHTNLSLYRSAVSNPQPSSASLPPSKPERAPMESTGRMAHPTSPQPKDTRPKTPPTSPPQKDSQSKIPPMSPPQDTTPKTPPTSPPQDSATLLTSVAASPQHGTPAKGVAGKVCADLILRLLVPPPE